MKKKLAIKKSHLANGFSAKIKQLHACISKDKSELAKLYKKAVSEVERKSTTIKKLVTKARKSVVQARKDRKKSPKNHQVMRSLLQSLRKGEALIMAEMEALKIGYKKFAAHEKSRQQVDKILAKTAKSSAK